MNRRRQPTGTGRDGRGVDDGTGCGGSDGTDSDGDEASDADGRGTPYRQAGRTATRRETLRAGGVAATGAGGLVAGSGEHWPAGFRRRRTDDSGGDHADTNDGAGRRADFAWLGPGQWREPRLRENVLAFAARHDLAVAYGQPPSNLPGVGETVGPALDAAADYGVDVWFNAGTFTDMTAEQFREDAAARERHLAGLRELAAAMGDRFDGGRVILWQEAPVMGRWTEGGEWTDEAVDNLLAHGPAVFAAQQAALADANPALDAGVFVHFPYIVDSKRPGVFADLVAGLRERGADPDFGFTDFYRGWYEKDVGPEPADAAVRSLVSNARDHLGTDVFYLGQAHTINPGHTPSAQTLRSTLRAALGAGAAGVGWYPGGYTPTEQGFDPFVPNRPGATFEGEPVGTLTVARDRYLRAWSATVASRRDVDPTGRFDCWLHGDGFGFYDHRVEARTADGGWTLLGDAGGYLDGDYADGADRTTAFRALDRDRLAGNGELALRITTDGDAAPATLRNVVALPWDPRAFVRERRATALLRGEADVAAHELGRATPGVALSPGETIRVTIPIEEISGSLVPLVYPEYADAVARLAAAEDRPGFDPDARFDLWVAGTGSAAVAVPRLRESDGRAVDPETACVVAVSSPDVALCYGLDRSLLSGGLELAGGTESADAVYAMPYAGAACFRTPAVAADLLAEQPDEVGTFALAASGA